MFIVIEIIGYRIMSIYLILFIRGIIKIYPGIFINAFLSNILSVPGVRVKIIINSIEIITPEDYFLLEAAACKQSWSIKKRVFKQRINSKIIAFWRHNIHIFNDNNH